MSPKAAPAASPTISQPATLAPGLHAAETLQYQSKFDLKVFQQNAIKCIEDRESVVVTAPTGSGKTVIAYAGMMKALREGRTFIYTAPLKAICEQKFQEFKVEIAEQMLKDKAFWKLDQLTDTEAKAQATKLANTKVGLITGDRPGKDSINPEAPVKIMTTEIYNLSSQTDFYSTPSRQRSLPKDRTVVFDELHYLGDADRGRIWEESIMFTPREAQVIGLSATIGNATRLTEWIDGKLTQPTKLISAPEAERPVKLKYYSFNKQATDLDKMAIVGFGDKETLKADHRQGLKQAIAAGEYIDRQLNQLVGLANTLVDHDKVPAIFFILNRKGCDEAAEHFAKYLPDIVSEAERTEIQTAINAAIEKNPRLILEKQYLEPLLSGVAPHHAEHLPEYKALVEELFEKRLVKIVFATSTLAAGINMPARTTVLTQLSRGSGDNEEQLTVSEFKQMAGRAGRAGLDTEGNVIVCADPGQERSIQTQYIDAPADDIRSSLKPNYQTLLTIINDQAKSPKELEASIKDYLKGSFMSFRSLEPEGMVQLVKDSYVYMANLLRQLGYIDGQNRLTDKGRMAKEIKFNNPVFVIEFMFALSQALRSQGAAVRAEALAGVLSLFAQGESDGTIDAFIKSEKEKEAERDKPNPVIPLLELLAKTQNDIATQQGELNSCIRDNFPSLDHTNFYTVLNWANSCVSKSRDNEIQRLRHYCKDEPPGRVIDALKRTAKIIEYLNKAAEIPNFPALLKEPLDLFRNPY